MARGSLAFDVAAPPEVVFRFVSDLGRAPEWVPELVSVTKLDPGPVRLGTRFAQVARIAGRESRTELRVTAFEPPRRFAHEGAGDSMRFAARFELEPRDGGTRVRHDYELHLGGLRALMEPLIAGRIEQRSAAAAEALKRAIERGA